MLIRPKFITNSSSSSYLVYGVAIDREELRKLLLYLLSKIDVHAFIAENKRYFKELNLLEYDSPEDLASDICDEMMEDEPDEWVRDLSNKRLEATIDWEGDYDTYLGIGGEAFKTHVEGDKIILDIPVEDYKFLQEICETLNFKDKDIGFNHWVHYG